MSNSHLLELYNETSKHSHYQLLATPLRKIISADPEKKNSKWEDERLSFIMRHLPCKDASIADIGGNTGYFTLELIHRGAKNALFIEGNKTHSDFVREAVSILNLQDKIKTHSSYMIFKDDITLIDVDITLVLNVLHHIGDDYGDSSLSISEAKASILHSLLNLSYRTKYLVLQLGFNWKGDINFPLFDGGSKKEQIDFIENGVNDFWTIEKVGVAETTDGKVFYNQAGANNIQRNDSLGEFLNRPLFIMKSKLYGKSRL
ncbi:hypothetical protein [uncultured Gilvimarinus sp.]|uniref:hypothetical protein n=1 Tax=uncultured Gilvimarinus sp. TaxID=1689143 RepID=UPI0030D8BE3C